ncbi:MAG: quinone-interacting membrane-bound oxidoreductase complex subunit QmoC [candidate division Zixibacteria bacterium]|nr:quinone-interacting membrane-bound oxidoreductase complex subunit QmoC [candidate division Zixibacteria bacterium]MDD5427403.1 quinone-interacting membrane-bound oxidoreductase complex subunit QmoC [candidate division Zixibacteria bacterium]
MAETQLINPDLQLIREIKKGGGETLKKCYQCATCSVVCNLSPNDHPFPRKEMILASWGQKEKLMKDPDIWMCFQCNDCSIHCPRGARPGDILAAIRAYIYKSFAFPAFMGKALASPKALPVLLLVPTLILLGCILAFAPTTPEGGFLFLQQNDIDFNIFLPHSAVDALFVLGNILIFIFAAVGFIRFWKGLQVPGQEKKLSFMTALFLTIKDIISHKQFHQCQTNKHRYIGHLLLFYGFIGAMVTTGAVFVFIFIPHYLSLLGLEELSPYFTLPLDLPNPVKFIGMFSGLALMAGSILLVVRRLTHRDIVGASGYTDQLFLYIMFFVGLTGMLSWLTRLTGIPMLAYVNYFIHLVVVFFLLWYMPYSKFAHMIYRTLALVHCRMIGRTATV